jgi:hypothetical protein
MSKFLIFDGVQKNSIFIIITLIKMNSTYIIIGVALCLAPCGAFFFTLYAQQRSTASDTSKRQEKRTQENTRKTRLIHFAKSKIPFHISIFISANEGNK